MGFAARGAGAVGTAGRPAGHSTTVGRFGTPAAGAAAVRGSGSAHCGVLYRAWLSIRRPQVAGAVAGGDDHVAPVGGAIVGAAEIAGGVAGGDDHIAPVGGGV